MGAPNFLAGETLAASQLKLQTVHICTSSTRPSSPFEGLTIYETDTNLQYTYDGSTWQKTGDISTGTSHTPTLAQGVSSNISKTVNYSEYRVFNGICFWWFNIAATAAGTAGSAITLTLPVTAVTAANTAIGSGQYNDVSVNEYNGYIKMSSTTVIGIIGDGTSSFVGTASGSGGSFAVASGDAYEGFVMYPVI